MSSIAYNLTTKLEWMGRKLRKIDDAADIKNWASAMRELNCMLKEVEIKEYKDNWRPWRKRNIQGKKEGTTDQLASTEPYLLSRMRVTVPQVGLEESSGSDLMNNVDRKWSRPPRVQVEGDDVDLLDPKAAVMKMLKEAKEQQEKTQPQREMSSVEKIKNSEMETEVAGVAASEEHTENIEMWRDCMVDHLRTENKPVQWWGSSKSVIFCTLCSECASPTVRIAAMEEWRKKKKTNNEKVGDFLYKELMIYYDKVK